MIEVQYFQTFQLKRGIIWHCNSSIEYSSSNDNRSWPSYDHHTEFRRRGSIGIYAVGGRQSNDGTGYSIGTRENRCGLLSGRHSNVVEVVCETRENGTTRKINTGILSVILSIIYHVHKLRCWHLLGTDQCVYIQYVIQLAKKADLIERMMSHRASYAPTIRKPVCWLTCNIGCVSVSFSNENILYLKNGHFCFEIGDELFENWISWCSRLFSGRFTQAQTYQPYLWWLFFFFGPVVFICPDGIKAWCPSQMTFSRQIGVRHG